MENAVQLHEAPTLDKAATFMKIVEVTVNSVQEELVLLQKQTESASNRVVVLSEQLNIVQKLLVEAQARIHDFEEVGTDFVTKNAQEWYLRLREENAALRNLLTELESGKKPHENMTADADC